MKRTLMTPALREMEIRELESEKTALHSSFEWRPCFNDDALALNHRRQLTHLIGALDLRIAELRGS